jgi:hypothetical protein
VPVVAGDGVGLQLADLLVAGIVKLLTWCGAARIGRCGDCDNVQGLSVSDRGHRARGWLYHRFALSLRDVEELMLARGVVVTYETIVRHEVARDERTARR